MAECPSCQGAVEGWMNFCPRCGRDLKKNRSPPKPGVVYLEDVIASCARCGVERAYGRLTRCSVCHERVCEECTESCELCGFPACLGCILDCAECGREGCAACFVRCESCRTRALCPEDDVGCADCNAPTCSECLSECSNCESLVCPSCLEEAHEKAKGRKR